MDTSKKAVPHPGSPKSVAIHPDVPGPARIRAGHIMTGHVFSVHRDATVKDVARLLVEKNISALPVMDHGRIVGIISESDLLHREELGNVPLICETDSTDPSCRKAIGTCAEDLMTPVVVTVDEKATLAEIADIMDREHIKHVPVVRGEHLVGIVSRADIVRALILRPDNSHGPMSNDDDIIRARVIEALIAIPGASAWLTEVDVDQGVVTLSGMVQDEAVLDSSRKVVADIPYVSAVKDHRAVPQSTWG